MVLATSTARFTCSEERPLPAQLFVSSDILCMSFSMLNRVVFVCPQPYIEKQQCSAQKPPCLIETLDLARTLRSSHQDP